MPSEPADGSGRRSAGGAAASRHAEVEASRVGRLAQRLLDVLRRRGAPAAAVPSMRSAFCSASSNVRPIAITSPTDFMPCRSRARRAEFAQIPARHLDDDVVERGLEAGDRRAGDRVAQLGERVAQADLGGDVRDRVSGRLRCERGAAREPRVDLDHAELARLRVQRELDVALAHQAEARTTCGSRPRAAGDTRRCRASGSARRRCSRRCGSRAGRGSPCCRS